MRCVYAVLPGGPATFALNLGIRNRTKACYTDPHALTCGWRSTGTCYQQRNTRTLIFTVPQVIAYLSRCMSLQPGDVISTGTPPGVGLGIKPQPVFLRAGQTIRLGIDGLG